MTANNEGKVYIASMRMRGARAKAPAGAIIVNATSAQVKNNENRRDFSPMTPIEGGYKGYWNFESYWQSGKVWEGIPHAISQQWWKDCKEAKRRDPYAGNATVLHARWDHIDEDLAYVDSRKRVYVREYYDLIKDREMTKLWQQRRRDGRDIVIYDFDGPHGADGELQCLPLTLDLLKEKIEDESRPFGHGYVVAATIAGITPAEYAE